MTQISETITFNVESQCSNPVYLRWKNRLGGWNYYLFDVRQDKIPQIDSFELFENNFKYLENITTVLDFYRKKGRFVWNLSAENITNIKQELLQELAFSPRVERCIGSEGSPPTILWETVIVEDYTLNVDNFKNRQNAIVQIRLLELQTLRNI